MVKQGDKIEWFSASYPTAVPDETIDGVHFVRAGRQWTVHWEAFRRYHGTLARDFDVVVDEVNTVPFFTPVWADVPRVMLIHQLAREVWWYESPFPLNLVGILAEPAYLSAYRRTPAITVSASTCADLRRLRFVSTIAVVPEGIDPISASPRVRPLEPTFLYVGRLAPSKRLEDVIGAFALFVRDIGQGRLLLVGDGTKHYSQRLQRLTGNLGVTERVSFLGRVPNATKFAAMAAAYALLIASVREGWGLVVTESNAFGTPAIAYNVPGLRDSVRDGDTGLLVRQSPNAMAKAMIRLWMDPALHLRLSTAALQWSKTFSFEISASLFRDALIAAMTAQSSVVKMSHV